MAAISTKIILFAAVAFVFVEATSGVAQTTDSQATPAAVPTAAPTLKITSTKFEDWYLRCAQAEDGNSTSQCEVAQIAQVTDNGKQVPVLTMSFAKPAPSKDKPDAAHGNDLILTALVPLNVFLPIGLSFKLDGKDATQMAYRNCNQAGCWSNLTLNGKSILAFTKAQTAIGHLQLMNGQNINIGFSTKGLSAALAELAKPQAK